MPTSHHVVLSQSEMFISNVILFALIICIASELCIVCTTLLFHGVVHIMDKSTVSNESLLHSKSFYFVYSVHISLNKQLDFAF